MNKLIHARQDDGTRISNVSFFNVDKNALIKIFCKLCKHPLTKTEVIFHFLIVLYVL
jgi:hypothetical protein